MAYLMLSWCSAALLAASFLPAPNYASPLVNVGLKASFNSGPYLIELLETAAEENSTCYFPLLDRIAEGVFLETRTDEELYDLFIGVLREDGHLRDEEAISSFKFALSLHSTAPRIEAHYQYYNTSVEPSMMVAQDAACPVWVHADGKQYCSPELEHAQQDVKGKLQPKELPFDRVLGNATAPASILYADISSPIFHEFHKAISESVREGQVSYRVRYRPPFSGEPRPLFLNGYGVELALKRTDYIVIDDRSSERNEKEGRKEDNAGDLGAGEEAPEDLTPLSSSEVLDLGLKAASFVMDSRDPFETLLRLSQDFPKHSSSVAAHNISEEYMAELRENRELMFPSGRNIVWLNGAEVDPRKLDPFSLLEILRRERSLIDRFRALGFTGKEAVKLLSHREIAMAQLGNEPDRYDYRDDIEGGNAIIWLNNIEKDKRYKDWPEDLEALLQRTYPGQMPQVRQNIHNIVVPVDLTDPNDLLLIAENLQMFVQKRIAMRFGFVPIIESAGALEQIKIAHYIVDTYGLATLLRYFEQSLIEDKFTSPSKTSFDAVLMEREPRADKVPLSYEEVLELEKYDYKIADIKSYQNRLAVNDNGSLTLFVNGVPLPRNENWLQAITSRVAQDMQTIQREVFEETFPHDVGVSERFLREASRRRNPIIAPEDQNDVKIIAVDTHFEKNNNAFESLPRIPVLQESNVQDCSQIILAADLDSQAGSDLVSAVLEFRNNHQDVEIVLIHNPADNNPTPDSSVRLYQLSENDRDLDVTTVVSVFDSEEILTADLIAGAEQYWDAAKSFIEGLGLRAGQNGLLINGRMIGPIFPAFGVEDFDQLLLYERSKRFGPVSKAISDLDLSSKIHAPTDFAKVSALVARAVKAEQTPEIYETGPKLRMSQFDEWSSHYSAISTSNSADPSIDIVATIDPTSQVAQRWIPTLKVLSELVGVHVKVFLSPREELRELPIKRFYRQVLESAPSFDSEGFIANPQASFAGMPGEALLNLGMDIPPAWLVAPVESIHDLDNIKLSSVGEKANVDAVYELEHILIQGHSRDTTTGTAPRGVQLLLETEKDPHFGDTIIMYNLGYFQFKAQPGHYKLRLKPGQSERVFKFDSSGGKRQNAKAGDIDNEVTLLSFEGKTLFPRLSRKPGHEEDDVLDAGAKASSAMDFVSKGLNFASGLLSTVGIGASDLEQNHADINIFSVASGHLYERMLNVMMVSVMKHTKHTVKFWFIEQFLSPSFKSQLPLLAKEYGFQYEMVTYKWPHWLRGQSEKQREIWGYKILFLDVLFPLSLNKVIFVDADQIVRTDMYELVTLDLEGAPYGFTPMCDSRTSMEGFRFWKQGYWQKYLQGLPYHISALYVVDLNRFRQLAAGDRLRGQYQQLSADPNSLSNLDQDLPNHMQHAIPIKTLPQNWLWCETWCADEDLEEAKTIDLCNNPETKEPKLDRARRQVPEWTIYDDEIDVFFKRAEESQRWKMRVGNVEEPFSIHYSSRSSEDEEKDEYIKEEL